MKSRIFALRPSAASIVAAALLSAAPGTSALFLAPVPSYSSSAAKPFAKYTTSTSSFPTALLTPNNRSPTWSVAPLVFLTRRKSCLMMAAGGKIMEGSSAEPAEADQNAEEGDWSDILPFTDGSHRSARISIPREEGADAAAAAAFDLSNFGERLTATVTACRELGKSSIWVEVPMNRCSLIEAGRMQDLGFHFHHALGDQAVLNLWLKDTESKVPEFATHRVGVGAVVVNSRDEILCVRELGKNYMPWKIPTGLSELEEQIDDAAVREVLEETGIRTTFHSILSFRQTHGLAYGRSDLFFVCRLDPIEDETDKGDGHAVPNPTAQACEIETAVWLPLKDYRAMINDPEKGHPMMRHAMELYDAEKRIEKKMVQSVIPGRAPNAMYFPTMTRGDSDGP